jgi:hypothetical protein
MDDFMAVRKVLAEEYGWETDELTPLPCMADFDVWRKWVCWGDGVDVDGRFIGFCPLHDRRRQHEGSAVFDFPKGMFRCSGDPSCHPGKRALSIQNLYVQLAVRVLA